jgi:hypothetical protein
MQQARALLKQYPKEIKSSVELVFGIGGNQSNAEVQYYIQESGTRQTVKILRRAAGQNEGDSGRARF